MSEPFSFEQRPILGVWWACGQCGYGVGKGNRPTRIEVRHVPGNVGMVPWFIVWEDDELIAAVNSSQVESVQYARSG